MSEDKSKVLPFRSRKQTDFQSKFAIAWKRARKARSGGRCLDAVWERDDLSTGEKAVLCQIGAFHNFKIWTFTKAVKVSMKRLAARTALTVRGVRKILRQLEDKKLLFTFHQEKRNGSEDIAIYKLSPKLFSDYGRKLMIQGDGLGEELSSGGDGETTHQNNRNEGAGGGTQFRGGRNSVPGEGELSSAQSPFSSPSSSPLDPKTNPPNPLGKGGSGSLPKISRYDKTNYDHLLNLSLGSWEQWKKYENRPELWDNSRFKSFRDLLGSYYPEIVLRLMAKLGPKWNQGIGRKDISFWRAQMQQEVIKLQAEECLATITDYPFLEIGQLVAHGMKVKGIAESEL